jgi:hypothetical protein
MNQRRPYADPYLAGIALGLVLLASFVLTARGLGASGAFASVTAGSAALIAPEATAGNPLLARYLDGSGAWRDWLVVEILGVLAGGFLSAWLAGRLSREVERGPRINAHTRIALAFGGGALMGAGAMLARGCTSGLALTGGALLGVGSWMFVAIAFAVAYAVAPWTRRAWR